MAWGNRFNLKPLDDPTPSPGEVVIKVRRCGICVTNLHRTEHNIWTARPPVVLGHEFAGEIVAIGEDVSGLQMGMRVTALPYIGCGKCRACLAGSPHHCPTRQNAGTEALNGGFAEYVKVGAGSCVPLPAALSIADDALVEPLAVGLHGVKRGKVQPGERILVIGAGPIGLAASRVAVSAPSNRRQPIAEEMGATSFIVANDDAALASASADALGGPPDIVLECVGLPGMIQRSLACVKTGGRVVALGVCINQDHFHPLTGLARRPTSIFRSYMMSASSRPASTPWMRVMYRPAA
jgi:threonine dehydrogenase-like Zn-dependent dehydrogenase